MRLDPHDTARLLAMDDDVIDAAHGHDGARNKGNGLRQAPQANADPGGMAFGKITGGRHRATRRHGEDDVACGRAHAQDVTTRTAHALQRDAVGLASVEDLYLARGRCRIVSTEQSQHDFWSLGDLGPCRK